MRIDHVIYGVADLGGAVDRFRSEYGLEATGGGVHPEYGTRNEIIPVGVGQYIELMAVNDPSSGHPLASFLSAELRGGDRPLAVCLRPDDLDQVAARLGIDTIPGERRNPDGEVLRWRLAGLQAALGPERLPFFIDWQGADAQLDRRNGDAATTDGIAWVEYGGDRQRLADWIGSAELPLKIGAGEPGPHAIALMRAGETLVVS